ncbi:MAG: SAP domain-containing protein [Deltaproteobacteria bacterium]|nr:MAG: SAP domain-containing protein [Deltaproteobacteria bacterium]
MKIQRVRAIAKAKGVNSARKSKGEIIRAIQEAEGNFPCFGTARDGVCDRKDCAWKEACLHAA